MNEPKDGDYVVLVTSRDENWVVMATLDPDCKQQAVNIAQGYLLCLPQGQVAIAKIVAYDTKYPFDDNEARP